MNSLYKEVSKLSSEQNSINMRLNSFLLSILIFMSGMFLTVSCINNDNAPGNYQIFNGLIGTIVVDAGVKYFRLDADGTYLFASTLSQFEVGDRILASAKVNYDNQIEKAKYLVAEFSYIEKIEKKTTKVISLQAVDTFLNHPIMDFTYAYITRLDSTYLFTTKAFFIASNESHIFNLVKNDSITSDTLKFEFRHNKKSDPETYRVKSKLISFDLSSYLKPIEKGKTKVVQITYKFQTYQVKQHIVITQ